MLTSMHEKNRPGVRRFFLCALAVVHFVRQ